MSEERKERKREHINTYKQKKWHQESHTLENTHTTHDQMQSELSRQQEAT